MAFANKKNDETKLDPRHATIISEGCVFEGNIISSGSIRIDGEVKGDVSMKQSVVLGGKGKITGNVSTREMIVFGSLRGNVNATIVEIKAGGSIAGDINTTQMTMELGGRHNGSVAMKDAPAGIQDKAQ